MKILKTKLDIKVLAFCEYNFPIPERFPSIIPGHPMEKTLRMSKWLKPCDDLQQQMHTFLH